MIGNRPRQVILKHREGPEHMAGVLAAVRGFYEGRKPGRKQPKGQAKDKQTVKTPLSGPKTKQTN